MLKESSKKKKSLKPKAVFHNNSSWYIDTDGFLECSPNGESLFYKGPTLWKIITCYFGREVSLLIFCILYEVLRVIEIISKGNRHFYSQKTDVLTYFI